MVRGFWRDGVGIRLPRCACRLPGGEGSSDGWSASVVVAADVHTVRCGPDIVQREDGTVAKLLFDAHVVLLGVRVLPEWVHHIVHVAGPEWGCGRQVPSVLG